MAEPVLGKGQSLSEGFAPGGLTLATSALHHLTVGPSNLIRTHFISHCVHYLDLNRFLTQMMQQPCQADFMDISH
jgi:hypothetical protein